MTFFDFSFIDTDVWDRAQWRGVAYGWNPVAPPYMGLLFTNRTLAQEIFRNWRERLGEVDVYEELRVAIIEGDIPRQAAGYSVHISTNSDGVVRRAENAGLSVPTDSDAIMTVSRIHRMTPPPTSRNLEHFQKAFARYHQYLLVPMLGPLSPDMGLSINKHDILFRNVKDIGPNDIDATIFDDGPPEAETIH